jgi:hypothetical protein
MNKSLPSLNNYFKCVAIIFLLFASSSSILAQSHERGFNIGIVYPLSVQGIHATQYTNVFSVQAFMGISKAERGFTASGFANIIRENASGFQVAGFLNNIGGSADGFKAAGFLNNYHDATGFQAAGFSNIAKGNVRGMQVAGFMNISYRSTGFQVAGFLNQTGDVKGTQVSGFINNAGDVRGNQVAGFINVAKKVKGVQVAGLINIADSSDHPIGIINIIGNGEKYLGMTTDDNLSGMITFRSGSKTLYGVIGLGYNFRNEKDLFAFQYGLGAHLVNYRSFRLKTEATVTQLQNFSRGSFVKTSLTAMPSFKIGSRIEIFAGPSLNYVNTDSKEGQRVVNHYIWNNQRHEHRHGTYVGYSAGVHFKI